jgi:hypothetical protein
MREAHTPTMQLRERKHTHTHSHIKLTHTQHTTAFQKIVLNEKATEQPVTYNCSSNNKLRMFNLECIIATVGIAIHKNKQHYLKK